MTPLLIVIAIVNSYVAQNEPRHDKTNKMTCAPSEDSDQPGHPPSLIRFFAVRMKIAWVLSYPWSTQRRLWSDWADAQADLSLRLAHTHFVGFLMSRLKYPLTIQMLQISLLRFKASDLDIWLAATLTDIIQFYFSFSKSWSLYQRWLTINE